MTPLLKPIISFQMLLYTLASAYNIFLNNSYSIYYMLSKNTFVCESGLYISQNDKTAVLSKISFSCVGRLSAPHTLEGRV